MFFISTTVRIVSQAAGPVDLLDLGAGDAWLAEGLLEALPPNCTITCWDINYTDEDLTHEDHAGLRRTRTQPDRKFDLVLMLDVLEHIADDAEFLQSVADSMLKSGGRIVFSVPAHPRLFSSHDTELGHFRRYVPKAASTLLATQFEIVEEGSLFASLLLPRAVSVLLEKARSVRSIPTTTCPDSPVGLGGWSAGPRLTQLLTKALKADVRIGEFARSKGATLPGLTYFAVCAAP